jgi:hypothetical protein
VRICVLGRGRAAAGARGLGRACERACGCCARPTCSSRMMRYDSSRMITKIDSTAYIKTMQKVYLRAWGHTEGYACLAVGGARCASIVA